MLSDPELEKIEEKALYQRRIHVLGDESPIGNKIFNLIENTYKSYMMLYPLKTKKVAGFTRKQGENIQIFINTSFNTSFQIFAAAHELYHLIDFEENNTDEFIVCNNQDISENIDDKNKNIVELKANYFSAAFLLPASVIRNRFETFKKSDLYFEENMIIEIIKLQYEYEVPFKTVLKRLKELKLVGDNKFNKLLEINDNLTYYCKMMDDAIFKRINELESPSYRKYHSLNVPKMAYDIYRNGLISFDKLESKLNQYDKNISDFNLQRPEITPIDIDFSSFGTGDVADDED
ncbi:ImmA/IrrE family metallo-endopeptidase [Ruminiclostridium herbifermentans]|uniref:ImmA/IrrE family metallo-endopeptidase n=1 Tax=Ruminiclostridium herbifermentans TaxID=2488810 RepID=A0A4U7JGX0_9FIRM|nr:ImmA/IrrE family metallo-endopeptidase [Ruminiclostridium herbifermentans]QNU67172.1 ImmA/IrrE family metallo-endopeptidase [Ruminiclostridium herbifermentans]